MFSTEHEKKLQGQQSSC